MATDAYNLKSFVEIIESWGLTDVMLPFLLIFTILFAILQKTNVLGHGKKNFNVVIALVFALLVVIPHVLDQYPPGADVVEIMNSALPNVSILIVGVIMALILIGLFGGESVWMGSSLSGWVAIISFLLVIFIFGASAGWWGDQGFIEALDDFFGEDSVALVIILLVFGIIVWYITKDDTKSEGAIRTGNLMSEFGKLFGGGKHH